MVIAGANRGHAGFDRFARRIEIMVADRQHDDVVAGLLARPGGGMDLPAVLAGSDNAGNAR
jgi:hypothetical protein